MRDLKSVIAPFLTNITDDCILYPFLRNGYGDIQYWNQEGKKRHYLAHRLSYEVYNGVCLKREELVLHSCDIPNCVNPRHLRVGTHKDNSNDKVSRNRQAKGSGNGRYTNGYKSKFEPKQKPLPNFLSLFGRSLDKDTAMLVKQAIKNKGSKSLKQISEEFGVNYRVLVDINRGKSYKNL